MMSQLPRPSATLARCPQRAGQVASVLKALGHPLRVRILAILSEGPSHVSGLAARLDVKQAIVSQQLLVLRMRGLVASTRQGGFAYYRITEASLASVLGLLEDL